MLKDCNTLAVPGKNSTEQFIDFKNFVVDEFAMGFLGGFCLGRGHESVFGKVWLLFHEPKRNDLNADLGNKITSVNSPHI